jgi:hypothetical protein
MTRADPLVIDMSADHLIQPMAELATLRKTSTHWLAANDPLLPESPESDGVEPLRHLQLPGAVASTRTRNVLPPSQNP